MEREKIGSRLGFLMLAAGSAVGLGNVWRFPYIVGKNGGAAFVLVYLFFLAVLGLPLLVAELSIGRGSKKAMSEALAELAPSHLKKFWSRIGITLFFGCFVLMIYYTDVAGWLVKYAAGYATNTPIAEPGQAFTALLANYPVCAAFTVITVLISTLVCMFGVAKGVERVTKIMMLSLLALLGVLAVKSLTLPGAAEGISFYLKPDWAKFMEHPVSAIFDALGQAFFTLSLGVGSMEIFGSYIDRSNSLVKEALCIIVIDTFVAFLSGLVIFPACASFGVEYSSGPGLIFVALPQVFSKMSGGMFWGFLFFLFLSFAALTTIIAVFDGIIGGIMDTWKLQRKSATLLTGACVAVFAMPCVFIDGVLDWEDFAVSQLWLPIGALIQGLFVLSPTFGWGWEKFRKEASAGHGPSMPNWMRYAYCSIIPALIVTVLLGGLYLKFK